MKFFFELSASSSVIWKELVDKALSLSDCLELNTLCEDQNLAAFLKELPNYSVLAENRKTDKFYKGRKSIQIPFVVINDRVKRQLGQFEHWQNHYLEDPSFWKNGEEILACISHENLVMVEMDYFADLVEGLILYNVTA